MTANGPGTTQNVVALFDRPDRRDLEFGVQANSHPAAPDDRSIGRVAVLLLPTSTSACSIRRCRSASSPSRGIPWLRGISAQAAFRDRDGCIGHEIAMNPAYFHLGDTESFQTLVHEMAHLWRHLHGKRNRKGGHGAPGYHDAVWADRMEAMGLMPSDTGKPGGKRTGYHMGDYAIEGGPVRSGPPGTADQRSWRELARQPAAIRFWRSDRRVPAKPEAAGSGYMPAPRRRKARTLLRVPDLHGEGVVAAPPPGSPAPAATCRWWRDEPGASRCLMNDRVPLSPGDQPPDGRAAAAPQAVLHDFENFATHPGSPSVPATAMLFAGDAST
jgi:hypothetical protein